MPKVESKEIVYPELLEAAFNYWLSNHNHVRTPFPQYIWVELQEQAESKFMKWKSGLDEKAKDDFNEEIVAEKLDEIIFEIGMELVKSEDEKFTILYPFMPRIGDRIDSHPEHGKSKIVSRGIKVKGDHSFMEVTLESDSGGNWTTEFELPV
jgi:hypothetical protein